MSHATDSPQADRARFAPTRWTLVLSAKGKDSRQAGAALETLCRTYWHPLYAFARRQGAQPADAQDATQEFFARMLAQDYLRSVAPEKGRFRSFLLVAFKRFLANEHERSRAQKRGGGQTHIEFDATTAEARYQIEPADNASADKIFERRWALTLLEQTMARLRDEFAASGKAREFDALKVFLTAPKGEVHYDEIAAQLGMTAGAARVAAHRLRGRFRELFREEIAHTVEDPSEIEDEVRHLLGVLAG